MRFYKRIISAMAVFAVVLQPVYAVVAGQTVHAANEVLTITTTAELRSAIENQDDGQVWNIQPGNYAVTPTNAVTAGGQTGWYFPVTKNNITINGIGNPTIYGDGFSPNGAWASQDLMAVFGNNVTVNGLTLMPKVQPNKTLEVLGENFTLKNTVFAPNTLVASSAYDAIADAATRAWAKEWGGSLYFNHQGNHVVENVTIHNGGVSYRYSPSGTTIALTNVEIVNATNDNSINGYRYSSAFNNAGNTLSGGIQVVYRVSSTLHNLDSVLANIKDRDIIELDSDLTIAKQITLHKAVALYGNGHTITADFVKTDNSNNAAIGVQADGVMIADVTLDGVDPVANKLHGINVADSEDVLVDGVTARNFRTGILYNGSTGTIQNVHTQNNIWHGINIDKDGANVNVLGDNTHTEALNIYVDDDTKNVTVNAPAYEWSHPAIDGRAHDRVYRKKAVVTPEVPAGETPTVTVPTSQVSAAALPITPVANDVTVAVADTTVNRDADAKKDTTEVLGTDEKTGETLSAKTESRTWSLANVLLTAAVAVMSLLSLAGIRGSEGRAKLYRILTLVPVIAAVVAVLIVEDFGAKLGWFNGWTILFAVIAIAQGVLFANSRSDNA